MNARSIPFWLSAVIHLAVIGLATVLLIKPPEFAMDAGHNSVEVNLVAAAPDPTPPAPPTPVQEPEEPIPPEPPKPDDIVVPVAPPVLPTPVPTPEPPKVQPPPTPTPVKPKPQRTRTVAKGDGSAPKPGKDAVTASSDGGAIMDAKPDYLSNPPPTYPEASRRQRQEGLVLLEVIVSVEGRAESISVQTSSGFAALDASAAAALRKWRFRPASLGSMKVKSRVVVPIRFRLGG